MKMRLLLVSLLVFAIPAEAQDLESMFSESRQTQHSRNASYVADIMRGILRSPTPEQIFFLRLIEESKWDEALFQFDQAFKDSDFPKTEDGRALKAFLLFRSGMPVQGLENLFLVQEPKKIHFQVLNQLREIAPADHPAWMVARLPWKKEWTELFGVATEVRVRSADFSISSNTQALTELSMLSSPDSRERAMMDWNLAIQYGLKDDAKKAAVIISSLMKAKNNPVPQDLMTMTAARLLYQNAYFEASQKYYEKIPKSSDYYFEAQEEIAWSFLRRRQAHNSLAITQSLVNPVLAGQVGPESWFVRASSQLKICDYPAALQTLKTFSGQFKARTVALEKLSLEPQTPEVQKALEQVKKGSATLASLTTVSKNLPRALARDQYLRQLVKTQEVLENESTAIDKLLANNRDLGTRAEFEGIKNSMQQRASQAKSNTLERVKKLAVMEVDETKAILNKLHIVEAEIIQQVETATKLVKTEQPKDELKVGTTGSKAQDVLKFPFQNEFWMDELTNYKVDIKKACLAKRSL